MFSFALKEKEVILPADNQMNEILGFGLTAPNEARTLKQGKRFRIIESRENEKIYLIDFPMLSGEEAWVAKQILEEFRQTHDSEKKKFSIKQCIEFFLEKNLLSVSKTQKEFLTELIELHAFGSGLIEFFFQNEELEEIALIGLGKETPVFIFHSVFGWLKTNLFYSSQEEVINLINRLSRKNGRQISMQYPKINAVLENGNRLNAVINPLSENVCITIRKFRKKPLTVFDLVQSKTVSGEAIALLELALKTDLSIIICGNTGSGKTTFLNSIFAFIPKNERIVIVEETPEINIPHKHKIKLSTVEGLNVSMNSLILNSLRMRPDRVIVGEIRSKEEIHAFIDTILAGQGRGSFATVHAQSAEEAVKRFASMNVEEQDLLSVDLIIVLRRITESKINSNSVKEKRRILEITEVLNENGKISLNKLFEFDYSCDELKKKNKSKRIMQKLKECFGLKEKEILEEMQERKLFFEKERNYEKEFIERG
ncbi:MAG: CpaF family protein [Candidatus Diapherotrites archaeon]|nr:CpaF family protein [Candidatus Diapherotrites archaeon]